MFVPEARVIAWSIGGTLKLVGAQIAVELDVSRTMNGVTSTDCYANTFLFLVGH